MRRASQNYKEHSTSTRVQPRARDDKKVTTEATNKTKCPSSTDDNTMESPKPPAAAAAPPPNPLDDVYEFKSTKDAEPAASAADSKPSDPQQPEPKAETNETTNATLSTSASQDECNKRNFEQIGEQNDETEDENRRKKRKEEPTSGGNPTGGGSNKDAKGAAPRGTSQGKGQAGKQGAVGQNKQNAAIGKAGEKGKSPCSSPKPASGASDQENDETKSDLKVPPLKIVISQSGAGAEQENGGNASRNGKNSAHQRSAGSHGQTSDQSGAAAGASTAPPASKSAPEEKSKDPNAPACSSGTSSSQNPPTNSQSSADEQRSSHQRVLRSSHRSGQAPDRGSNNSSPQLQRSHSPSPSASPAAAAPPTDPPSTSNTNSAVLNTNKNSNTDAQTNSGNENDVASVAGTSSGSSSSGSTPQVELHPRKRKMKPSKEVVTQATEAAETPAEAQIHPHDQPITNCYQLFLNIRKQIDKRRRGLFPVQPKPPQGFKDYLMNRCTYVLASNAPTTPNISYPPSLPAPMKDLFTEQEKDRYRLRTQHVIEKEKLVLSVEQEILRVHGRAARALANQSLPFSVCTILRDEEVYNLITPEQEEKDRNARSRYNGRLFLSWLQDVDDKWEKIKEHMLLRHHNEAESLHAVQKMDWEWKMKELSLCDRKSTPSIDEHHVPMVHVSDDFDLLPA